MMNTTDIHDPTFFDKFFVSIGVFVTASFLSFSVVALALRPVHPYSEDLEEDEEKEEPFKKRFYDEFNEMERVELTDDEKSALAEKHLRIETDDGEVVIRYNSERDSFDYWCDNSNIGYLELDAAAQAYAIENNCASVVVNYKKEYDTALEEWKKKNETDYCEGCKTKELNRVVISLLNQMMKVGNVNLSKQITNENYSLEVENKLIIDEHLFSYLRSL